MKNFRLSNKEGCKRQEYRDKRDEVYWAKVYKKENWIMGQIKNFDDDD